MAKIKEIVGAALEREPSERRAFLDQACSRDERLRSEVESLLVAHAMRVDFPRVLCAIVGVNSKASSIVGP